MEEQMEAMRAAAKAQSEKQEQEKQVGLSAKTLDLSSPSFVNLAHSDPCSGVQEILRKSQSRRAAALEEQKQKEEHETARIKAEVRTRDTMAESQR